MWDVKACRACLAVKGKLEKIGDAFKRLYTSLTGLQITDGDGYPNYFCLECRTQIRKCLAFRRKSRRAHFVLKEIMSVRKQVTYSDIITVNRKKTNLESSLTYWDPQKTGYLLINQEDDSEKTELESSTPTYNTRVVDIKPEIKTIEAALPVVETVETPEEIVPVDDDVEPPDDNDFNDFEEVNEPIPENIDLNDIFKDLNDDQSEHENAETQPKKEIQEKIPIQRKRVTSSNKSTLNALMMCNIKVLNLEEQKIRMDIRRQRQPFVLAPYKCSMCLTIYKNMQELLQHVEYHNNRRQGHECDVCKNKYHTVEELNIHVAQCHLYEYECRCDATYYCLADAVKHCRHCPSNMFNEPKTKKEMLVSALKNFTVKPLSQRMMTDVQAFRWNSLEVAQMQQPDDISNHFKCDVCGVWIHLLKNLEKHMILKHKYLYTCNECKEVFTARSEALAHVKVHKKDTRWICEECGKQFKLESSMKTHKYKYCRAQQKSIPCNLCGRAYRTRRAHYIHQIVKHKYLSLNDPLVGDPQFKCADCEVQFVEKRSLDIHVVSMNHAGASDVMFACLTCKKVFDNEEQIETHYITCVNPKKYPRKCCYCEEVLVDGLHYKKHYIYKHPTLQYRYTSKNSICELCGKTIPRPQLEAHRKSHEVASYECRYCNVTSLTPTAHVIHVLCYHAAKPYHCVLCTRRFQYRSDCKHHILKVHAPTKLYQCEFCNLEFSFFRHLKDHSEKQHNHIIPMLKGTNNRSRKKILVYAHMKIEISLLEKEAVEKTEVALLDYLDQKSKPVDYKDFFIFNSNADEYVVRIDKQIRKRDKRRIKKENDFLRPKIKIESDILIKPSEEDGAVETMEMNEIDYNHKFNIKEEVMAMEEGTEVENAVKEIQDMEAVEESENGENGVTEAEEENPLEVFESEGKQYVMIGGEMYRIATDGED